MVDVKEINNLYEKLVGINTWIVNNPEVKEPNYYEIMKDIRYQIHLR